MARHLKIPIKFIKREAHGPHLEQFNFETRPPALYSETSFAYACGASGGARR
jgi:hypothetical protein